jgi:hypothetical protein
MNARRVLSAAETATEFLRGWGVYGPIRQELLEWAGFCLHCLVSVPLRKSFCDRCVAEGHHEDRAGRCYNCADTLHDHCIGVPCECGCPYGNTIQTKFTYD